MFGSDSGKVSDALRGKPVWIDTHVATPSPTLKGYADAKVATLTNRGLLVVITTQPRAWRISMNPVGMVSSEATRLAGEAMTAQFKKGRFAAGAIALADELDRLSKAESKAEADGFNWWPWALGGGGVVTIAILLVVWSGLRSRRVQEARLERQRSGFDPDNLTNAQRRKAERVFARYTPAERQQMAVQYVNTPGYNSSMTDSPFFWWWLMSSNNHPCCHESTGNDHHRSSLVALEAAPEPSRSSWSAPSSSSSFSSSDSGGSSGSSWDSGSSSFDSASFSDSSGSSGSW